jgi:hypothetical protein
MIETIRQRRLAVQQSSLGLRHILWLALLVAASAAPALRPAGGLHA